MASASLLLLVTGFSMAKQYPRQSDRRTCRLRSWTTEAGERIAPRREGDPYAVLLALKSDNKLEPDEKALVGRLKNSPPRSRTRTNGRRCRFEPETPLPYL
jgi:hypothetical protein